MNTVTPTEEAYSSMTEVELVERTQNGDEYALNQLCSRLHSRIFAQAFSMLKDYQEAEDATQDSLLKISQKLGNLRECEALYGWVGSLVRRTCLSKLRQEFPTPYSHHHYAFHDLEACTEEVDEDVVNIIRGIIGQMRPLTRRAMEVFYFEDHSLCETAEILSQEEGRTVPVGTVKRRLHTARQEIGNQYLTYSQSHPEYLDNLL